MKLAEVVLPLYSLMQRLQHLPHFNSFCLGLFNSSLRVFITRMLDAHAETAWICRLCTEYLNHLVYMPFSDLLDTLGVHEKDHGQQLEGGGPPLLFCPGEAMFRILCPVLASPFQKTPRRSLAEGHNK